MKSLNLLIYLTTVALLFISQISNAEERHKKQINTYKPTAEQMIIDGLVYRPLGLAGTLIGTGVFIVTLPFSILGGNVHNAGNKLVLDPAKDTFARCLGCINYRHD